MSMNNTLYAAKRFKNIGNGVGILSPLDNSACLLKELARADLGRYFLTAFYAEAKRLGVEVDTGQDCDTAGIIARLITDYVYHSFPLC